MHQLLTAQYEGVKGARQALFSYCRSMNEADLHKKIENFNNSSILLLLAHVANAYVHWIKFFDRQIAPAYFEDGQIKGMDDIEAIYREVDEATVDFLSRYRAGYEQTFTKRHPRRDQMITTTPLLLYTHVITHEFHHKGQILAMSRLLGYTPVDTDVIRT